MVHARVAEDRVDPYAGPAQPDAQVVILAAPADKALVEAVDGFVILAPNSKIATVELRLRWMANQLVILVFEPQSHQPLALRLRHKLAIVTRGDCRQVDPFGRFLIEPIAIAGPDHARPARAKVRREMLRRKDAIAVGE